MTKWQNIHSDFTEQLLHEWIDKGFTFEKIKSWINNGLVPNDAAFANYLENKGYSAKEILNYNLVSLKEDYNSSIKEKGKEVIKIAEKEEKIEYLLPFDMDGELRKIDFLSKFENDVASRERWWEKGFKYEQAQEWIKLGLEIDEEEFADYIAKILGYNNPWGIPKDIVPELRKNFEEYQLDMAIAMSLKVNEEEKPQGEKDLILKAQIQEQGQKK